MTQGSCLTCGGPLDPQTGVCPQCVTYAKTPSAPSAPSTAPQGPPEIPGYKILDKIGEGGMGALYLAEESTLGRRVAIKVISHRIAGDAMSTARFLREARTLATIEHPHVVRVYSFGEVNGSPYLVMEYVEGETLAQRLGRAGRLPIDESLRMTRQIVEALEAAWERKIVHRDIKPSNILLDRRNQVRVADFGLAKPHEEVSDFSLTHSNAMVGTPHYVSPEQAQGKEVDFRSDVYSLGIMLYQMLTGERPFEGTTPVAVIAKHLSEPLPALGTKRPEAGASVERILRAMTEKDPERRPASYAKIHQALDSLLGTTPSSDLPTLAQTMETPRARRPLVRMPLLYFAAVAIPLAVLFAVTRNLPTPADLRPASEGRLVVAVAPFYGPDDDSAREGKVMAALIEREIIQKLGTENVRVIGMDETKKALHSHDEARALATSLKANAVIWGDAFALRKETEIQPHVTVMPLAHATGSGNDDSNETRPLAHLDDAAMQHDRGGGTVKLEAEAPNQIELRRTSAAGIGDVITLFAGIHALSEQDAKRALDLFQKAPQTAETIRYEVQALLIQEKNAEAQTLLERAISLEPNDAGSHALLGDLFAAQEKTREAAQEYSRADELKAPYHTQRGIVVNGRLYLRETYRSINDTQNRETDTPYLIGVDPATDRVVERYSLPEVPQSFEPVPGGFIVSMTARDNKVDKLTFRDGKWDRFLWPPANLLERLRGLKSATTVIDNFSEEIIGIRNFGDGRGHAKLTPSKQMNDDQPKTFADLEATLRAKLDRDPTTPWTPFLLALTLDAESKHAEANAVFDEMVRRDYGVPFYEYSWMLNHLERMRKDAWATALYPKALAQRNRLPQPPAFATLIERLINANFARQAACNADEPHGYTILQRARQLTGLTYEADDFASAAWLKYFREKGDTAAVAQEQSVFDAAHGMGLNLYNLNTKYDYALDFLLAAFLGYLAIAIGIINVAARRARIARTSARRTLPRIPQWIDVVVCATLAIGFAYYVAAKMREMHPPAVVLTIVLGVLTALIIHARTSSRLTMFDVVAAITRGERRMLLAVWALLVIAVAVTAWRSSLISAVNQMPIGLSDSPGHPFVVRQIEKLIADREPAPGRLLYLGAVVNHFAGNTARAKQLYTGITTDAAATNLAALNEGKLPAVPLTEDQVSTALAPSSFSDIVREFTTDHGAVPIVLALLTIPVVLLLLARSRDDFAAVNVPRRFKLIERIALAITPGAYDLATNRWLRAYATIFIAGFVVLPIVATIKHPAQPGLGPITANSFPNLEIAFPMPFDAQHKTPWEYGHWTFRWMLPYAKIFWPAIVALIAFVLASHIRRIPRILRSDTEISNEIPTVITAPGS